MVSQHPEPSENYSETLMEQTKSDKTKLGENRFSFLSPPVGYLELIKNKIHGMTDHCSVLLLRNTLQISFGKDCTELAKLAEQLNQDGIHASIDKQTLTIQQESCQAFWKWLEKQPDNSYTQNYQHTR